MDNTHSSQFDPKRLPFFKAEAFSESAGLDFSRFAVEMAADEVFLMQSDSKVVYVNRSACHRLGYREEELIGKYVWEWDPLFPESAWPGFWRQFVNSKHLHFESEHKTKSGEIFPVEIHAHYFVESKTEYLLAFVNDLTEKKQLEAEKNVLFLREKALANSELAQHKHELEEAQRLAKVGSWKLDHQQNQLNWSAEIYRIFEIDPQHFGASYESFLDTVHPEDRERVGQAFESSVKNHQAYEIEHRLQMVDYRIKYVIEKGETFYDEAGLPTVSIGTVQDITERKMLELASIEARQHYQVIFEKSPDAYLIMELDGGRISDCNHATEVMLKGGREEILGMRPDQLSPPYQPDGRSSSESAAEKIVQSLKKGHHQFDWVHRRLDGVDFWADVSISVISIQHRKALLVAWRDISERKQLEKDLNEAKALAEAAAKKASHQASHDALTGLVNRFSLNERLEQMLSVAMRAHTQLAVLFIDMDRFKQINDSVGHQAGDAVIQQVAERLKTVVKRDSDVIARIGGDEFIVVLNEAASNTAVAHVAKEVIQKVSQPYHYQQHALHSTGSIGIAMYPSDGQHAFELMKNADIAMYHAKAKGRNKYTFFCESINENVKEDLALENDLHFAIENNQLSLHYQPLIDTYQQKTIGLEALLRWQHPKKGFIPPDRFIEIAERSGQILEISAWVIHQVCEDLAAWQKAGHPDTKVAINISVVQLRSNALIEALQSNLAQYHLPAERIEIEITESVAMDDPEKTIEILNQIKTLGCKISIDDFGTGYSSLAYLKNLPVNTLKLDRSFVKDIETDENDRSICRATISLAHSLGLSVVAEGVETAFQQDFLTALKCDYLQGYLFSKPVPFDQVVFHS